MFSAFNTIIFIPTHKELKRIWPGAEIRKYASFNWALIKNTPVVITGIGKTNAAITACRFFNEYVPKKSILIGICGAYKASGLNVGDTVTIIKDYFIDEGSFDGNYIESLQEKGMPICENNSVIFTPVKGFKQVVSNTVSLIPVRNNLSEIYRTKKNAHVENMEGAAFGLAALKYGATVYQLRTISNFCGEEPQWNIKKATDNLRIVFESLVI